MISFSFIALSKLGKCTFRKNVYPHRAYEFLLFGSSSSRYVYPWGAGVYLLAEETQVDEAFMLDTF